MNSAPHRKVPSMDPLYYVCMYLLFIFLAPSLPEYNFGFSTAIPWVTENDIKIRGLCTAYVMEFWHKNG